MQSGACCSALLQCFFAVLVAGGPSPISANSFKAVGRSGSFCFWGLTFESQDLSTSRLSSGPWRTLARKQRHCGVYRRHSQDSQPCRPPKFSPWSFRNFPLAWAAEVVCVMLHCDAEVWQVTGTGTDSTLQWSGPQKVHWDTGKLEKWTKWTKWTWYILMHLDASWCILMHLDTSWCTSSSELCYKMLQVVQGNRDERLWKNHWGSWVFESWQWRRSSKCLLAPQNSLFALSVCHRCEPLPEATPQKERRCSGLLHCGSEDGWCRSNQPLLPCVLASLVLRGLNPYFHIFHDSFIFKFDCWLVFSSEQRFVSWRFKQCKEVNGKNGIANCGRLKVTWLWRSAFVNILFTPTKAWLEVDVFQFFS